MLERKFVALHQLKAIETGAGGYEGYVSVFSVLDDGGDIVLPGAYKDIIDDFLANGFTAQSHDWDMSSGVVGFPTKAIEDDYGLYVTNEFHSTPDAQSIRTKVAERIAAGKQVGLSIGYRAGTPIYIYPKDYEEELPKYVKPADLEATVEKAKKFSYVRVLPKIANLKESSIVTSPMNTLADVANVKDGVRPNKEKEAWEQIKAACADLGLDYDPERMKAGARNSRTDKKRVQTIHDLAVELEDSCCDSGKSVVVSDALKAMLTKALDEVKGMYESALAEMTAPTPWQVYYAYLRVVDQIDDLRDAAEGTDVPVDVDALVEEALAAMVVAMREATQARLDAEPSIDSFYYYGQVPGESKFKKLVESGLVSGPFDQHSEAVVTAAMEMQQDSAVFKAAITDYLARAEAKQTFRLETEGRGLSAVNRSRKSRLDVGLEMARDNLIAAGGNLEALVVQSRDLELVEGADDLTAKLLEQRLRTAKLRTQSLAATS